MNRLKLLQFSIGLTKKSLTSTQVINFSNLTHFNPFNSQQNALFSSKPQAFINLVLSIDSWSEKIEKELDKMSPKLTHESVSYVLMNSNANPQKSLDFFNWVCVNKGFSPSFMPCFILLRCLACKEFMPVFWNVFEEMKKRGFYMNEKAFSTIKVKLKSEKLYKESVEWDEKYREMVEMDVEKDLAKEVVELILTNDWGDGVKREFRKKMKFPLKENFLLRMISELWPQPLKGLKFFEWIRRDRLYKHDSVTYNAMAQVLAHHKTVSYFWDFVKQMRMEGYKIDIYTYMRSSKHLPIKDTVDLFELMMDGPYQPSLQHTTSLLSRISYELEPDLDLVRRVFNKTIGAGNVPNKVLYDCVHRALCNLGKFDEAKKIVESLRESGCEPDNFTYSQEISGLCKAGRFDEACKVVEQMETEGCVPTVKTWTMLIKGLCEANRVNQALSCLEKMKEINVKPSPETLSVLLNGFFSENKVNRAYTFLKDLVKEDQLKPQLDTYKLMIVKLMEAGKFDKALNILRMMKQHHHQVFPQPITQYISKYGTVDHAKRLLAFLTPTSSIKVYGKVIEAFLEQGRYSEAKDLAMASYYSQEISGLCKAGRFDEACKVVEQMETEGCAPTVKTWTMLIKGLCEANRVNQALSCLEKMKEINVKPSPETLSVLLNGFFSENKVNGAYTFLKDLVKEDQLKPQLDTYKLMIVKLMEAGKFDKALNILRMMKQHHHQVFPQPITQYISKYGTVDHAKRLLAFLTPTSSIKVYGKVIEAFLEQGRYSEAKDLAMASYDSQEISGLCKAGRFDEACKVVEQMETEGCVPTVKTWTMLIKGLCEANRVNQALSCLEKMKEINVKPSPETLSVLLNGFFSENKVNGAYTFLKDLVKEDQLKPQLDTYKLMIVKLMEAGKFDKALNILRMMKQHHHQVFPQPITQYISKYGTVDHAKRLLAFLTPTSSIKVYGKVIEAFLEQGRYSEAKDLAMASYSKV